MFRSLYEIQPSKPRDIKTQALESYRASRRPKKSQCVSYGERYLYIRHCVHLCLSKFLLAFVNMAPALGLRLVRSLISAKRPIKTAWAQNEAPRSRTARYLHFENSGVYNACFARYSLPRANCRFPDPLPTKLRIPACRQAGIRAVSGGEFCGFIKGSLLVEVIVGTSIFILVIVGLYDVFVQFIKISSQSPLSVKAAYILEEGLEAVRSARDDSWSNNIATTVPDGTPYYLRWDNVSLTPPEWQPVGISPGLIDGKFTRSYILSAVNRDAISKDIVPTGGSNDPGTKKVTMIVTWTYQGANFSKQTSFYIADLFNN